MRFQLGHGKDSQRLFSSWSSGMHFDSTSTLSLDNIVAVGIKEINNQRPLFFPLEQNYLNPFKLKKEDCSLSRNRQVTLTKNSSISPFQQHRV